MHKVQMNSGASDTIRARVARFNEFDNGHVLFNYQKMTEAEFEERAKAASIKDPNDVYYVAIDNIMDPGTDVYWFQGKSYDYEGAEKALSQYRKSGTSGLNSGRKSLNSSDEQVRVIGTVTIYSDFVDFKQSVSEHLLQTAVGSKAKLKFKWLGDNKVEVRAICSAEDERKVKILLENSDVTKTIAWATSGNSGRRRQLGLNSGCGDLVKKSTATLKRKLKDASPEEIYAKYSPSANSSKSCNSSATCFVDTNGIMGIPGDTWTLKELAEYWNSEQGSDPCLDEYASFDDWVEDTIAAMRPVNSSRKPAHKGTRKKLNSSKKSEILELTGWSHDDLAEAFDEWLANGGDEYEEDEQFDAFADAVAEAAELGDTDAFGVSLKASRKMNSSRKVGNNSMRKVIFRGKLNSSRKLNSSHIDDLVAKLKAAGARVYKAPADSDPTYGYGYHVTALGISKADYQKAADELGIKLYNLRDTAKGVSAVVSVKMNSSRKPASKGTRKKLNSSWYWDKWNEYCDAIPVTPEMQKAVDAWFEGDGFVVEKALVPKNRKVQALLKRTGAIAMLFNRIPGGTSFDDEEILGWTGTEVNDDLAPYNLVDILEAAGVNDYDEAMNASRKLNSSFDFEKLTVDEFEKKYCDEWGYEPGELTDIVKHGEQTIGGRFLGLSDDDCFVFEEDGKPVKYETIHDRWYPLDSSRKLNSSEEEPGEPAEGVAADGSAAEGVDADGVTAEDNVQDTGIDGGETPVETAELLDNALIVQNPETKEVSLFVATEEDEILPESVDVIAEITPVVEDTILDSSRRLKKFATAKLNSSKGCLNSDAEGVCSGCGNPFDECTCEAGTVAYDEIQLPDDTVVEVENILVVKGEDDDLGLFMPDDADDTVPEDYEVVAVATPVAEVEVLDSSRRLKKTGKKLNR